TNTAALVFTGVGSAVSSLPELRGRGKFLWRLILIVSLGSIFGSALLLIAPASTFEKIVPFFIIAAGLLLLFSGKLPTQEHRPGEPAKTLTFRQEAAQTIVIFVTGAYAGYF
ncbi:sulfite exporter TauE/SafE family protein, partial [Salmonella enterica subsp. enterica serovar Istanbul]|nr:sulfite exporter TauE/SafE family protein [Salmonella enterica subsp. enterica serovar Istanbul]